MSDLQELLKKQTGHYFSSESEKPVVEAITYTTSEMAAMLQVSEATIRKIIQTEKIPTIPCTKNIIVMKSAFDEWCKSKEYKTEY